MTLYVDILPDDSEELGIHRGQLSQAVCTWAWMQQRETVTVAEAAMTFNTTPELIRQAVEDGAWTFLSPAGETDPMKQTIEHEGE